MQAAENALAVDVRERRPFEVDSMLAAIAKGRNFSAYAGKGSLMSWGVVWMLLSNCWVTLTVGFSSLLTVSRRTDGTGEVFAGCAFDAGDALPGAPGKVDWERFGCADPGQTGMRQKAGGKKEKAEENAPEEEVLDSFRRLSEMGCHGAGGGGRTAEAVSRPTGRKRGGPICRSGGSRRRRNPSGRACSSWTRRLR